MVTHEEQEVRAEHGGCRVIELGEQQERTEAQGKMTEAEGLEQIMEVLSARPWMRNTIRERLNLIAEEERAERGDCIGELAALEAQVRGILEQLPVKARATFEAVLQVYILEGMGIGWGSDIVNEIWHGHAAIVQARRELADDPDLQVLERVSRLAAEIGGKEFPQIDEGPSFRPATDEAVLQGAGELIAFFSRQYLPAGIVELVQGLRSVKDHIARADNPEDEIGCIEAIKGIRKPLLHDLEAAAILAILRKYAPQDREAVVSAALCQARATARAATALGKMEGRFAEAIKGLDDRTKAILRIVRDLSWIDGRINSRFQDVWQEVVVAAPVDVLRSDPAAAELLAVFDQGQLLNETTR